MSIDSLYPQAAAAFDAPVRKVTLLEDRAQVRRSGKVSLKAGQNRLDVKDVAPVMQDVSVRAEVSGKAKVLDARVRRAMRVTRDEKPEVARQLEGSIESLARRLQALGEDQAIAAQRCERFNEVLERGFAELPEDASWGLVQPQAWKDTFEVLFKKVRALRQTVLEQGHSSQDLQDELQTLAGQRQALDRPDLRFVAWVEVDLCAESAGEVEVAFEYTVPNALWRPLHQARLADPGKLEFQSQAAVWQNTGEDWKDAQLCFSTARSSLGTEPPLLSDDLLTATKKSEKVVVQARQVAVQKARVEGGATQVAAPRGIELPGVDDGGEIRNLVAGAPCTVPSDLRPNIVPLFSFEAVPRSSLVAFPELEPKAFLKSVQKNEARFPILAGPVELLQKSGFVGWTQVLFVAPGEEFALSFGPDDAVRLSRKDKQSSQQQPVDKWTVASTHVILYLSNLGGEAKTLELTERMPVSEIEHVKVELVAKRTSPKPEVDANGFCRWTVELPANSQAQVSFGFQVATAPGVQGL
ncbi:MAG: mucoidy inhibitor MuiA family protein [Myxococcaceae bacterium]